QQIELGIRLLGQLERAFSGVVQSTSAAYRLDHLDNQGITGLWRVQQAGDRTPHPLADVRQCRNERKRDLVLAQVGAERLAGYRRVLRIVEKVVDNLKRHSQGFAEPTERLP